MKELAEFKNRLHVHHIVEKIEDVFPGGTIKIMEVCGTHTMAIGSFGLRGAMPEGLKLISGPGCPVCVTPNSVINAAIDLASINGIVVTTFGDMMRVPGSEKTLEVCKAEGADVRVVYSPYDILAMAEQEKQKEFVFISVGFETTTPGIALALLEAEKRGLRNISLLAANRLVIPAMNALSSAPDIQIDGYLCPGHVSVVIGWRAYRSIVEKYHIPCVVAGFEPVDIVMAIYEIVKQISEGRSEVVNAYGRVVTEEGNLHAQEVMWKVFKSEDAEWRGIGTIPKSGQVLQKDFSHRDALKRFDVEIKETPDPPGCRCGDVLKGVLQPPECAMFGKQCTPQHPVGPCMVSSEGSCAAYYKYGEGE